MLKRECGTLGIAAEVSYKHVSTTFLHFLMASVLSQSWLGTGPSHLVVSRNHDAWRESAWRVSGFSPGGPTASWSYLYSKESCNQKSHPWHTRMKKILSKQQQSIIQRARLSHSFPNTTWTQKSLKHQTPCTNKNVKVKVKASNSKKKKKKKQQKRKTNNNTKNNNNIIRTIRTTWGQ